MKIFVENESGKYQQRVDYVVDFINSHPLCPNNLEISTENKGYDRKIIYGRSMGEANYLIPAQEYVFSDQRIYSRVPYLNSYLFQNEWLYAIEGEEKKHEGFLVENKFQFDFIETIFYHLSRYEEFYCEDHQRDRWDMMIEDQQILVKNNLEKQPVVDQLVKAFFEALDFIPKLFESQIRMTHDIDLIKKFKSILSFIRFNAYYYGNGHGIDAITKLWESYYRCIVKRERPYDVFDQMLLEKKLDKEIYFLIGGSTPVDTPLDTKSDIFKKAIKLSKERGYKIGIHPSYATWKDVTLLKKEKGNLEEIIDREITISRQHYLHFSFAETIGILEEAGIQQDSTLGYNRRIGFRAGTGIGFKLYDLKNDKASSIVEKPLVFMDSSLFVESEFNQEKFISIAQEFLQSNQRGTEITCNFHNSRFDDARMFGLPQDEIYKAIING